MRHLKSFESLNFEPTIYFAHPINTYGTPIESECLSLIQERFPSCRIINPGEKDLQKDFTLYRQDNPNDYMRYFKQLVNDCNYIVYLPFRDEMIGAGIWYEIQHLATMNDNIYQINLDKNQITKVSLDWVNQHKLSIEEARS